MREWKKCVTGCHQHTGDIWSSSWRWQSQRGCIKSCEKKWANDGTLRYITRKIWERWNRITDEDCPRTWGKIRWKPVKRSAIKNKPILTTMKTGGMIDSVKGSRLIKKNKRSDLDLTTIHRPSINFVALFWTICSLWMSLPRWGVYAWMQKSKCGLTIVLYSESITALVSF